MSRIDDLIQELCPDGVEHVELRSTGTWYGGGTPSKSKLEYWTGGSVPWISPKDMGGRIVDSSIDMITEAAVAGSAAKLVPPTSIAMVVRSSILDHTFPTAIVPVAVALNQDMKAVVPHEGIMVEYLAHVLSSRGQDILRKASKSGGSVTSINNPQLLNYRIPVPPLEVQREIVQVLDKFTQLEVELEVELEAELEARRAQYAHYRRELLSGGDAASGRMIPLGEIFEMRAGTHIKAAEISDEPTEEKPYPCYGGNGLRGYVSSYNYDESVIFVGRQGALCGNVHRAEGKTYATEHAVVVTPKVAVDMSWAFHKLTEMDLNQYKTKSAQPGLAVGRVKQVEAQYVPVDDQRRDGEVLDKLDALVNDISIGLPAELTARRKQYEYYRDHLLSFKEAI